MKKIFSIAIMIGLLSFAPKDELTGKWESKSSAGTVSGVIFKPDNSFEAYVNNRTFISGWYTFKDGIFTMGDHGCQDITGAYKLTFFGNGDSLRLNVINDDCYGRRQKADKSEFGRVKE